MEGPLFGSSNCLIKLDSVEVGCGGGVWEIIGSCCCCWGRFMDRVWLTVWFDWTWLLMWGGQEVDAAPGCPAIWMVWPPEMAEGLARTIWWIAGLYGGFCWGLGLTRTTLCACCCWLGVAMVAAGTPDGFGAGLGAIFWNVTRDPWELDTAVTLKAWPLPWMEEDGVDGTATHWGCTWGAPPWGPQRGGVWGRGGFWVIGGHTPWTRAVRMWPCGTCWKTVTGVPVETIGECCCCCCAERTEALWGLWFWVAGAATGIWTTGPALTCCCCADPEEFGGICGDTCWGNRCDETVEWLVWDTSCDVKTPGDMQLVLGARARTNWGPRAWCPGGTPNNTHKIEAWSTYMKL